MTRMMLIDAADADETRVVITNESGDVDHFDFISKAKKQIKGNIYLAKVTRVEPSLQAAFVEYGAEKQGFLPFGEIHPDYYQIPMEDRQRLIEEEAQEEARRQAAEKEDESGTEEDNGNSNTSSKGKSDKTDQDSEDSEEGKSASQSRRRGGRRRGRRKTLNAQQHASGEDASRPQEEQASDEDVASSEKQQAGIQAATDAAQPDASPSEAQKNTAAASEEAADTPSDHNGNGGENAPTQETKQPGSQPLRQEDEVIATAELPESEMADAADTADEETDAGHHASEGDGEPEETTSDDSAEDNDQDTHNDGDNDDSNSDDDEEGERPRPSAKRLSRKYKIQEVIRPGQLILVQVIKDERGNKGVSLSTYISIAGRYCVLMPNSYRSGGISRKISTSDDRKRLRKIAEELTAARGMNAIIRTAGIDRTKAEIRRDYEHLIRLWNQIRETALASMAPALVYEENDIIKRSIRDFYNSDIESILVQGDQSYRQAKDFMKMLMPSHAPRVKQFKESQPLFTEYDVERQLSELYRSTARLKSGGYIVIDPTEALVSIDVNSGRSTNERNVEETAYKTNLEACTEIARQLRLRNMGGLVVIDFIDMNYHKYRRNVERTLKEALRHDRARIQVGHISSFGLLEMSRQRMGTSLVESTTTSCETCHGTGRVQLQEATVMQLMRHLQSFITEHTGESITIETSQQALLMLMNHYRDQLHALEAEWEMRILFEPHDKSDDSWYLITGEDGLRFDAFDGFSRKQQHRSKKTSSGRKAADNRKRSRGGKGSKAQEATVTESSQSDSTSQQAQPDSVDTGEASSDEQQSASKGKRRSRRGGRNRSRNRDKATTTETAEQAESSNAPSSESSNESSITTDNQASENTDTATTEQPVGTYETHTDAQDEALQAEFEARPSAETAQHGDAFVASDSADTAHVEPTTETTGDDTDEPQPEMPQTGETAESKSVSQQPPEDTPPPAKKRRGWWQRVLEG